MKKSQQRKVGVLLHISSLPDGTLGEHALRFVDFLSEIGASVWQTLPLNMPHGDGSPYQCLSAHAGNPAFINMQKLGENLEKNGLISTADAQLYDTKLHDTDSNAEYRQQLLEKAFTALSENVDSSEYIAYRKFCRKHSSWLKDFSLFLVLRKRFDQASWNNWPEAYKKRDAKTLNLLRKQHTAEIGLIQFTQFVFFEQWSALKQYANNKNIAMFGDIPIFVAFDSADVWANPNLFKLNKRYNMTVVAGVPPDYFSATGQRWGNPHYNWSAMKNHGFKWWIQRMATQNRMFDMVRIDHFRGLQAAWEIPASEATAMNGVWRLAPGYALLWAIKKHFKKMCLVAEDLGVITDEVNALRHHYNLPGMKILQFAFGGGDDNLYLPNNIEPNSVVYTGTHDNDTSLGWYLSLEEHAKHHLHAVLNNHEPAMPAALIDMALATNADLVIIPMQDILALDSTSRMNTPGTLGGNWVWKFDWQQLTPRLKQAFADSISKFGRANGIH
ncbi:4-alpha-glucanotransferase [Methylotenera versatilis]|uniref:4-alpha-glucanotransferase n=1 Tax=Methylotenera versatilis TaxID=1055487 RepID=UPI000647C663|nr:4-alpha-glucanotransferase [Methylotenera versatilis]